MNILVFDNYDSFTYNLVHMVEKLTHGKLTVVRNDQIELEEVNDYDKIILSPGPGIPSEAGILLPLIKAYAASKSILGVCLGHQAIGQAFGANLVNLPTVFHGVATPVKQFHNSHLFTGMEEQFMVGRYHSWVIDTLDFPKDLTITVEDENHLIMGLQHQQFDVQGVQFHPESILTPDGEKILANWLKR